MVPILRRLSFLAVLNLLLLPVADAAAVPRHHVSPFVTRAEAVMILLQARLGSVPVMRNNGVYPDVAAGAWYERYIVLAARFGILEPEAGSNRLYPNVPINRAAFMKLLTHTFNLNLQFPKYYRDVRERMWFANYAGIAERYRLFPEDRDKTLFQPGNLLTPNEVARAVQIVVQSRENALPPIQFAQTDSADQTKATISTRQELMTMVVTPKVYIRSSSSAPALPIIRIAPLKSRDELRAQVLQLVNTERARRGLIPLRSNTTLESSAQLYADTMATKGFFGHTSPTGETFRHRIENSGFLQSGPQEDCFCVRRVILGENLARGQLTPKEVYDSWLASPAHRDALFSTRFTDTGIGISGGMWVEQFGGVEIVPE